MKQLLIVGLIVGGLMVGWTVIARDFADRTPQVDPEILAARMPPPAEPREPAPLEERVAELEQLVERLYRITDPFEHRDEMRLERRVRDLEEEVERLRRDIRRLEAR